MKRLPMRKIRDAMRLRASGFSTRKIAASLGVSQSTASEYLKRVERAGLSWPLPDDLTDAELERRLFHPTGGETRVVRSQPDWPAIHRELRRKGVTLSLLWEEHRAVHPDGYGYSRFCELYRRWEAAPDADHAPAPCRRRADVRRLRRRDAGGDRSRDRRSPRGAALRRRARRLELHLRRGKLDAGSLRLDRRALPGPHLFRRRFGRRSSRTTSRPASPGPASTSRRSTAPTPTWPRITTPRWFRRGRASRGTRPRSRL